MRHPLPITLIVAVFAFSMGYFFSPNTAQHIPSENAQVNELTSDLQQTIASLESELANLREENALLKGLANSQIEEHGQPSAEGSDETIDSASALATSENEELGKLLAQIEQAIGQEDFEEGLFIINGLIAQELSPIDREAVVAKAIELRQAQHDKLAQDHTQLHHALWDLMEIHKLEPSEELNQQVISFASSVLDTSYEFLETDDTLLSADYVGTIHYVLRAMNLKEAEQLNPELGLKSLAGQRYQLQQESGYNESLKERVVTRLDSDDELEPSLALWDVAQVLELEREAAWENPAFKEQVVRASIANLDYLKANNLHHELQGRMDYIRYAFPEAMDDERLLNYPL